MSLNTSHSLLDRLRSASTAADWDTFVAIYHPLIRQQLLRSQISTTDADDICQETLTQIFKALPNFEHNGRPGAFRNWLKKIVRQKIWQSSQRPSSQAAVIPGGSIAANLAVDHSFDNHWEREHDRHVVNQLLQIIRPEFTDTSWNSFRRVVIECESPQRVADSLSISLNAVLISKSRIMKRLREIGRGLIDQLQ